MEQYLIDTNCVSDYLSSLMPDSGMAFMDDIINKIPNLSVISEIELLCWNPSESDKIIHVKNFIDDSKIYNVTPEVVMKCVSIRKGKKIKTPDAIIAATALAHNFTLISNNETDFKNIPKLKILNPYKM